LQDDEQSDIDQLLPASLDEDQRKEVKDTMQGMVDSGHLTIDIGGDDEGSDFTEVLNEAGYAMRPVRFKKEGIPGAKPFDENRAIDGVNALNELAEKMPDQAEEWVEQIESINKLVDETPALWGKLSGARHEETPDRVAGRLDLMVNKTDSDEIDFDQGKMSSEEYGESLALLNKVASENPDGVKEYGKKYGIEFDVYLDGFNEAAKEKGVKTPAQDEPQGQSTRCEDGTHRDPKTNQCKPI